MNEADIVFKLDKLLQDYQDDVFFVREELMRMELRHENRIKAMKKEIEEARKVTV